MKYSSKDLKAMARLQLTGKYSTYIGAYILYSLITNMISLILNFTLQSPAAVLNSQVFGSPYEDALSTLNPSKMLLYMISTFIFSLILSVLLLGFNKMFLDGSRGAQVRFSDLFYGFHHHPDRVILMQILQTLISVACVLPGSLLFGLGIVISPVLLVISIPLMILGIVLGIYFSLSFSQSMYLMADYDDLGPVQALKESRRMMVGNKGRLFYIRLSFIGISLLCLLSCNIGFLWAFPYMSMTYTNFYRNLGSEI